MTSQEAVEILEEIKTFCNAQQIEALNKAIDSLLNDETDSEEKAE